MAALLGENELVLRGQPQVICVAAVKNDDLARADKQIPALDAIVDDRQAALDTCGHSLACVFIPWFFFVSRRILRRVDAITDKAHTIMAGNLSGRLPVAGTGDEIDRLALNVNAMLDRIESLMRGFKEVSDNVAHDLKTPLTRPRNRCEAALRSARSDADYRAWLAEEEKNLQQ